MKTRYLTGGITESITRRWKVWYFFKRILTLGYGQGGHDRILTTDPSGSGTAATVQDGPHEEDQNEEDQNEEDRNEEEQYEDVELKIHFSVHMLHKKRGERQEASEAEGTFVYDLGPLKGYNRALQQEKDDHAGAEGQRRFAWERKSASSTKSNVGHCFEEQAPGEIEERLLRGWVTRAEQWWKRSIKAKNSENPSEEIPEEMDKKTLDEINAWLRFIKEWDPRIDLESNKKQTLVYFFKERLERDELFQPISLESTGSVASLVAETAGTGEEEATVVNEDWVTEEGQAG